MEGALTCGLHRKENVVFSPFGLVSVPLCLFDVWPLTYDCLLAPLVRSEYYKWHYYKEPAEETATKGKQRSPFVLAHILVSLYTHFTFLEVKSPGTFFHPSELFSLCTVVVQKHHKSYWAKRTVKMFCFSTHFDWEITPNACSYLVQFIIVLRTRLERLALQDQLQYFKRNCCYLALNIPR